MNTVKSYQLSQSTKSSFLQHHRNPLEAERNLQHLKNIEDADAGESTDETIEEFKKRLDEFVMLAIEKGKTTNGINDRGRDEYKESGTVFDVRKKVIAEFLKGLSGKKRCEHCAA